VDTSKIPQANLGDAYVISAQTNLATIKGSGDTSGTVFSPTMVAYLVSIDGKNIGSSGGILSPVKIEPGIHSLLLSYMSYGGTSHGYAPVMLDAKPGATYIVKEEYRGSPLKNLTQGSDLTHEYLYLEDEATGLAATDKITDSLRANTNYYVQPTLPDAASLHGDKHDLLLGASACFIASVDGKFIPPVAGMTFLDHDQSDFDAVAKISPGRHAIAIGIRFGNAVGAYPFLLDATASNTYVVKCTQVSRKIGTRLVSAISLSVENETTHEMAVPPRDLPIGR
tara:strand:+ start:10455 stop:11300 length:846 start_codon:yes stop_codon:yes gene_type:complete